MLATLLAASAAPAALAGGGQRLVLHDGNCEMTVPANWKISFSIHANAPDNSAGAGISSDDSFTLAEVKRIAESNVKPTKVFEDTSQRFWYQFRMAGARGTRWYVAVPGRQAGACHADIFFTRPAQAAIAKQIALSVKPAP